MERTKSVGVVARGLLALCLAAAAAALPSEPARGQEAPDGAADRSRAPAEERSGPEIDVAAALLTPLSDLVQATETRGALQLSTGAGLRAGAIWWVGRRLGIGAGGVWTPVDLDRQASAADGGGDGVDPGGKVGEADYLAGMAEVVLALGGVGRDAGVRPYLVAGAGVRRLSIDGGDELPDGITDPVASLGGGFRMDVSRGLLLRLEARDMMAPAEVGPETRMQHDLTVSVGLGIRP